LLEVRELHFWYGRKVVLRSINLYFEENTITSIIGPNGSGKTTLIKILAGILSPAKGRIIFKDMILEKIPRKERARYISYVPQKFTTEVPYTVREILMMGRYPYENFLLTSSESFRKIEEVASKLGIEKLLERPFAQLSGGEQRMVVIARALVQDTPVIVLDEPSSFLDITHKHIFLDLLLTMKNEGKTVIMVTHDLNTASLYSDQVTILKDGTIFRTGTPEDVLTFKNIFEAFNTEVYYTLYPGTRKPVIAPMRFPIPFIKKEGK